MDAQKQLAATDRVEQELLGICLRYPEVIDEVACTVTAEDWRSDAHRRLWAVLSALHGAGNAVTVVTVANELHQRGQIDDVGGYAWLAELCTLAPTAAPAPMLAKLVRDYSILRQLGHAGGLIAAMPAHPTGPPGEMLGEAEKLILTISQCGLTGQAHEMVDVVRETMDALDMRLSGAATPGISTGLSALDELTGGLHPGQLTIIGARPSVGKTSLALALVRSVVMDLQITTLFVSLEQSARELCERLLAATAGVDGGKIQRGQMTPPERQLVLDASCILGPLALWIDDAPGQSMTRISATARRLRRQKALGLVVVDYLQLIEPDNRKEPRHEQVARISKRLKQLARDLGVPVVALAQLNRGVEARGSEAEPRLSDLRDSGQVEQDADTVWLLHKLEPSVANNHTENQIAVKVAKNRNGPTGDVVLTYERHLYRFADVAREPQW